MEVFSVTNAAWKTEIDGETIHACDAQPNSNDNKG